MRTSLTILSSVVVAFVTASSSAQTAPVPMAVAIRSSGLLLPPGAIFEGRYSPEGGSYWQWVGNATGFAEAAVDVSMAPNGTQWAVGSVANGRRIHRSTDHGATWVQTNASGFSKVDANDTYVYGVGATDGDVWRAPSNSATPAWTRLVLSGFRDISASPTGKVWGVTLDGRVQYSSDNGVTWFNTGAHGFQSIDANDTFVFACGTSIGDIWHSTSANPSSWTDTRARGFRNLSVGPMGRVWSVGTSLGDLWFSTNNGTQWTDTGHTGFTAVDVK